MGGWGRVFDAPGQPTSEATGHRRLCPSHPDTSILSRFPVLRFWDMGTSVTSPQMCAALTHLGARCTRPQPPVVYPASRPAPLGNGTAAFQTPDKRVSALPCHREGGPEEGVRRPEPLAARVDHLEPARSAGPRPCPGRRPDCRRMPPSAGGVSLSGTCQRVATTACAPASWNACRRPATPSPLRTWPSPVSQALRTTSSVPRRSVPTISRPVSTPSSPSPACCGCCSRPATGRNAAVGSRTSRRASRPTSGRFEGHLLLVAGRFLRIVEEEAVGAQQDHPRPPERLEDGLKGPAVGVHDRLHPGVTRGAGRDGLRLGRRARQALGPGRSRTSATGPATPARSAASASADASTWRAACRTAAGSRS